MSLLRDLEKRSIYGIDTPELLIQLSRYAAEAVALPHLVQRLTPSMCPLEGYLYEATFTFCQKLRGAVGNETTKSDRLNARLDSIYCCQSTPFKFLPNSGSRRCLLVGVQVIIHQTSMPPRRVHPQFKGTLPSLFQNTLSINEE